MKPVIVSIFSLFLPALVFADCKPVEEATGSHTFWQIFSKDYGPVPFPRELVVCTGRSYFFEVKGGAKMQSALDRKRGRILLRRTSLKDLMHELAHVYLDVRWRILPYSVAEPLALAMADAGKCQAPLPQAEPLAERWARREKLNRCELLQLLKDVLNAPEEARRQLVLR